MLIKYKLAGGLRGSHPLKSSSLTRDIFKAEKNCTKYHAQVMVDIISSLSDSHAKRQCNLGGKKSWQLLGNSYKSSAFIYYLPKSHYNG
jgi:hypothetical protein